MADERTLKVSVDGSQGKKELSEIRDALLETKASAKDLGDTIDQTQSVFNQAWNTSSPKLANETLQQLSQSAQLTTTSLNTTIAALNQSWGDAQIRNVVDAVNSLKVSTQSLASVSAQAQSSFSASWNTSGIQSVGVALSTVNGQALSAAQSMNSFTAAVSQTPNASNITATASAVSQVSSSASQSTSSVNSFNSALSAMARQLNAANQTLQDVKGAMDKMVDGATNLRRIFEVLIPIDIIASGAKMFFDATNRLQGFLSTMSVVTGSVAASKLELQNLFEIANKYGVSVTSLTESFAKLAAAARGTTLEGQKIRDVFESIVIASSAMHLSSEDTRLVLYALQQMVSKGTVAFEELRRQMAERFPGAMVIAAQSMGMTNQAFQNLVRSGKLFTEDFLPGFAAGIREAFSPALAVSTMSLLAAVNRVQNAWEMFLQTLAQSQLTAIATRAVDSLRLALASIPKESIENIGYAIGKVIEQFTRMIETFSDPKRFEEAFNGISAAVSALGTVLGVVFDTIVFFAPVMEQKFQSVKDFFDVLRNEDWNYLEKAIYGIASAVIFDDEKLHNWKTYVDVLHQAAAEKAKLEGEPAQGPKVALVQQAPMFGVAPIQVTGSFGKFQDDLDRQEQRTREFVDNQGHAWEEWGDSVSRIVDQTATRMKLYASGLVEFSDQVSRYQDSLKRLPQATADNETYQRNLRQNVEDLDEEYQGLKRTNEQKLKENDIVARYNAIVKERNLYEFVAYGVGSQEASLEEQQNALKQLIATNKEYIAAAKDYNSYVKQQGTAEDQYTNMLRAANGAIADAEGAFQALMASLDGTTDKLTKTESAWNRLKNTAQFQKLSIGDQIKAEDLYNAAIAEEKYNQTVSAGVVPLQKFIDKVREDSEVLTAKSQALAQGDGALEHSAEAQLDYLLSLQRTKDALVALDERMPGASQKLIDRARAAAQAKDAEQQYFDVVKTSTDFDNQRIKSLNSETDKLNEQAQSLALTKAQTDAQKVSVRELELAEVDHLIALKEQNDQYDEQLVRLYKRREALENNVDALKRLTDAQKAVDFQKNWVEAIDTISGKAGDFIHTTITDGWGKAFQKVWADFVSWGLTALAKVALQEVAVKVYPQLAGAFAQGTNNPFGVFGNIFGIGQYAQGGNQGVGRVTTGGVVTETAGLAEAAQATARMAASAERAADGFGMYDRSLGESANYVSDFGRTASIALSGFGMYDRSLGSSTATIDRFSEKAAMGQESLANFSESAANAKQAMDADAKKLFDQLTGKAGGDDLKASSEAAATAINAMADAARLAAEALNRIAQYSLSASAEQGFAAPIQSTLPTSLAPAEDVLIPLSQAFSGNSLQVTLPKGVPEEIGNTIVEAAQRYGVNPITMLALAQQESGFNPNAVGQPTRYGQAQGLFQFLPSTSAGYGINPFDVRQAADAAARMFAENLRRFGADTDYPGAQQNAIRAHFAGPDTSQWGPKTEQYLTDVEGKMAKLAQSTTVADAGVTKLGQGADKVTFDPLLAQIDKVSAIEVKAPGINTEGFQRSVDSMSDGAKDFVAKVDGLEVKAPEVDTSKLQGSLNDAASGVEGYTAKVDGLDVQPVDTSNLQGSFDRAAGGAADFTAKVDGLEVKAPEVDTSKLQDSFDGAAGGAADFTAKVDGLEVKAPEVDTSKLQESFDGASNGAVSFTEKVSEVSFDPLNQKVSEISSLEVKAPTIDVAPLQGSVDAAKVALNDFSNRVEGASVPGGDSSTGFGMFDRSLGELSDTVDSTTSNFGMFDRSLGDGSSTFGMFDRSVGESVSTFGMFDRSLGDSTSSVSGMSNSVEGSSSSLSSLATSAKGTTTGFSNLLGAMSSFAGGLGSIIRGLMSMMSVSGGRGGIGNFVSGAVNQFGNFGTSAGNFLGVLGGGTYGANFPGGASGGADMMPLTPQQWAALQQPAGTYNPLVSQATSQSFGDMFSGFSFGGAVMGAGIGYGIGSLGAHFFGNPGNQTGMTIGGLVGGIAGSIAGPIGSIVGSALGTALGSLFGGHEPAATRGQYMISAGTAGFEDNQFTSSRYGNLGFSDAGSQYFSGQVAQAFNKIVGGALDQFDSRFSTEQKDRLASTLQKMSFPEFTGKAVSTEDFINQYGGQVLQQVVTAAFQELDPALGSVMEKFKGTAEEVAKFADTLLSIHDATKVFQDNFSAKLGDAFVQSFRDAQGAITSAQGALSTNIKSSVNDSMSSVKPNVQPLVESIQSSTDQALSSVKTDSSGLKESLQASVSDVAVNAQPLQHSIESSTNAALSSVTPDTKPLQDNIQSSLNDAVAMAKVPTKPGGVVSVGAPEIDAGAAEQAAKDFVQKFVDNVNAALADATQATADKVNAFVAAVNVAADAFPQMALKMAALDPTSMIAFVDALGGAAGVAQKFTYLAQNFTTSSEKVDQATNTLTQGLNQLGITAIPQTHEQFLALLSSFDLTTDSGRTAYAAVMNLSDAFVAIHGTADQAASALKQANDYYRQHFYTAAEQQTMSVSDAWNQVHAAWNTPGIGDFLLGHGFDHIPTTIKGFRDMIDALDAMGPDGQHVADMLKELLGPAIVALGTDAETAVQRVQSAQQVFRTGSFTSASGQQIGFYSPSEQLNSQIAGDMATITTTFGSVNDLLKEFGITTIPTTLQGFRSIMEGLDRIRQGGGAAAKDADTLYNILILLAPTFLDMAHASDTLANSMNNATNIVNDVARWLGFRSDEAATAASQFQQLMSAIDNLVNGSGGDFGSRMTLRVSLINEQIGKIGDRIFAELTTRLLGIGENPGFIDVMNSQRMAARAAGTEMQWLMLQTQGFAYDPVFAQLGDTLTQLGASLTDAQAHLARFTELSAQYGPTIAEQLVSLEDSYHAQQAALAGNNVALAAAATIFNQKWNDIINGVSSSVDTLQGILDKIDKLIGNFGTGADKLRLKLELLATEINTATSVGNVTLATSLQDTFNTTFGQLEFYNTQLAKYGSDEIAQKLLDLKIWHDALADQLKGNASGLATLDEIYNRLWNDIVTGTNTSVNNLIDAYKRIKDFLDSLVVGELSPLTPFQRFQQAQEQFGTQFGLAQSGNADAINSITQYAQTYLQQAGQAYGTASNQYQAIFDAVTTALSSLLPASTGGTAGAVTTGGTSATTTASGSGTTSTTTGGVVPAATQLSINFDYTGINRSATDLDALVAAIPDWSALFGPVHVDLDELVAAVPDWATLFGTVHADLEDLKVGVDEGFSKFMSALGLTAQTQLVQASSSVDALSAGAINLSGSLEALSRNYAESAPVPPQPSIAQQSVQVNASTNSSSQDDVVQALREELAAVRELLVALGAAQRDQSSKDAQTVARATKENQAMTNALTERR